MSSGSKNKLITSFGKSTRISLPSGKKVSRDLKQQFDDYVLREQEQASESNNQDQQIQNQQLQPHQAFITQQEQKPSKLDSQLRRSSSMSGKKYIKQSIRKSQLTNRKKEKISIGYVLKNQVTIPRSYLVAMEHLQNLIENKNQQINELKIQLIGKQEIILQCQSRINQILVKYNQLMDMYSMKQNQVVILKQQMQELRLDKQTALKQAAKAMESEFKPFRAENTDFTTFKQRSVSNNINQVPQIPNIPQVNIRQPDTQIISNNSSRDMINSFIKENNVIKNQNYEKGGSYRQLERGSQFLLTKNFIDPSNSSSRAPLLSHKSTNRDFISYQRQILRNQKQLIALKYRMQCMERKLSADPKQQEIKNKIRKLSHQIQVKQKTINDLKRI